MKTNSDNKKEITKADVNLAAAFGWSADKLKRQITSRKTSVNITLFDGKGNTTLGKPIDLLTFNEAAAMMRKDGIEGTNKQFDILLARKRGVRLSSGVILKDNWASKGVQFPTIYDED